MIRRLLLLSSLWFANVLQSQAIELCGKLTESDGQTPIADVHVREHKSIAGVVTDIHGEFCIEVNIGSTLEFVHVGYSTEYFVVKNNSRIHISLRAFQLTFSTVIIQPEFIVRDSFFSVGSGTSLNQRELRELNYTDINRIVSTVAGVNIQEEDGFGLRPNIGMRGSGSNRSSKITLMEDGILIAPAPYAAAAAYYFPTLGRMEGIEILKGSSQIPYGPNTTGGAVNLISAQFTEKPSAQLWMQSGSFNTMITHSRFSNNHRNFSYVAEYFRYASDGFKTIDDRFNTGFNKSDYLVKLRYAWGEKTRQNIQLKLSQTDEVSNETYLGTTKSDFDKSPFHRYEGSQNDRFEGKHNQITLRYSLVTAKKVEFSTVIYRNKFHRNWYKLDKLIDTSGKSVGISSIVQSETAYPHLLNILRGSASQDGGLLVKANNRDYYSQGIQSNFGYRLPNTKTGQYIHGGIRLHQDGLDRFQWVDNYTMDDGQMKLHSSGIRGTESNLLLDAAALSAFAQYDVSIGKWQLNPGVRYESIDITETNYGKLDPERTGSNQKEGDNVNQVVIPGFGFKYAPNKLWSLLGGIHRGFTPASVDSGAMPELSINSEFGFTLHRSTMDMKAVAFHTAYNNLLTSDAASSGGGGSISTFNGGKAEAYGLEFEASLTNLKTAKARIPLSFTYTYTNALFLSTFNSEFESWGAIEKGDEIPYVASHQVNVSFGVVSKWFQLTSNNRFTSDVRTIAGQDELNGENSIPAIFISDMNLQLNVGKKMKVLVGVNNILNNTYAASTWPAGYRPGMPRYAHAGFRLTL